MVGRFTVGCEFRVPNSVCSHNSFTQRRIRAAMANEKRVLAGAYGRSVANGETEQHDRRQRDNDSRLQPMASRSLAPESRWRQWPPIADHAIPLGASIPSSLRRKRQSSNPVRVNKECRRDSTRLEIIGWAQPLAATGRRATPGRGLPSRSANDSQDHNIHERSLLR